LEIDTFLSYEGEGLEPFRNLDISHQSYIDLALLHKLKEVPPKEEEEKASLIVHNPVPEVPEVENKIVVQEIPNKVIEEVSKAATLMKDAAPINP